MWFIKEREALTVLWNRIYKKALSFMVFLRIEMKNTGFGICQIPYLCYNEVQLVFDG